MSAKGANYFLQLKQRAKNSPVGAGEKSTIYCSFFEFSGSVALWV
jgi:hypothetical protein